MHDRRQETGGSYLTKKDWSLECAGDVARGKRVVSSAVLSSYMSVDLLLLCVLWPDEM